MRKHSMRKCAACAIAMLVISGHPVMAQSGWPTEKPATAKAASASATIKSAAAASPAKPAVAAPKVVAKAKSDAPAAWPAAADAAKAAAPKGAAVEIGAAELVQALQQQSELLKRLAVEMESQRTVIKEQQDKIKALEVRAAAPVAPSAAPAAKAAAAAPAITVETGGVKMKVSGLFQGWYTAGNKGTVDTFRLRRAELKFSGDISPRLKWALMIDPAKALSLSTTTGTMGGQTVLTGTTVSQSGRMLQDAYVALNWKPALSIELGQQKLPLGYEGTVSSAKLDTVERALFMTDKSRGAGYADIRDFGVIVRGKAVAGQIEYSGGVFNGFGEAFNDIDRNEEKSMVGRVIFRPSIIKGLQVGASIGREEFRLFDDQARERQGVDLSYARGMFGFRTEYMGGRDAVTPRGGGYAQVTARVAKPFTAVVRFDTWDPDTRSEQTAATVTEKDWLGGFTYVLHPSGVWLQANYIRKTFDGVAPSRNVFMTNLQTAW